MSAKTGAASRREHLSFFRQSGWMLLATGIAGLCFAMVHIPASRMTSKTEWSLFATLLDSLYLFWTPASGLQAVFAQMTACAVDEERRAEVRGAVRRVLLVVTTVWIAVALVAFGTKGVLLAGLRIENASALWLTFGVGLVGLWFPIFGGLLQGSQNFLWLGTAQMTAAAGRLAGITFSVLLLGGLAAGAMGGVLVGVAMQLAMAVWASRREWWGRTAAVAWGPWIRRLTGLTLGLAPLSVLMAADSILIQSAFGDEGKDLYLAAGRIGRGLVTITTPLAIVLFPKIARSAATGETTQALKLAFGSTLAVGMAAALGCTLFPQLTLQIMFGGNQAFLGAAQLVPWYAWSMLPLAAAFTLINNLLARGRFSVVFWVLLVAGGYVGALFWLRTGLNDRPMFEAFRNVILTLGLFSILLLGVAILFSFRRTGGGTGARPT